MKAAWDQGTVREGGHHPSLRGMETVEGGNHEIMELLRLQKSSKIIASIKMCEVTFVWRGTAGAGMGGQHPDGGEGEGGLQACQQRCVLSVCVQRGMG